MASRQRDSLHLQAEEPETQPNFRALSRPEEVLWDYRTSRHSVRGHPMLGARRWLKRHGLPNAVSLNALADGTKARFVGLVICRQQPGTATGVTFYTLEDETGFVNLVVWRPVFEKYSVVARTAAFLGATGKIQSESGVVHLVADELWDPDLALRERGSLSDEGTTARSFH